MKNYRVALTRDYIVEIQAENWKEAKECVEFFVAGGVDVSTAVEKDRYKFEIKRIKPVVNEVFEIEEISYE